MNLNLNFKFVLMFAQFAAQNLHKTLRPIR